MRFRLWQPFWRLLDLLGSLALLTPLLGLMACSKPAKPQVQDLDVAVPYGNLYARVAGDPKSGDVMITLHGGPGQSHHYMLDLERLAGWFGSPSPRFGLDQVWCAATGAGGTADFHQRLKVSVFTRSLSACRKVTGF